MNRSRRRDMAAETLRLLHTSLESDDDLGRTLKAARDGTVYYPHDAADLQPSTSGSSSPSLSSPRAARRHAATTFEVRNERSLSAARRVTADGHTNPVVLNFASAKNPGGGFLRGSDAQEESLARCSGLYFCIKDGQMYADNRCNASGGGCLYLHAMLYSPSVPVLRGDRSDDKFLDPGQRFIVSFISAPAVNAGIARQRGTPQDEILSTMRERIRRVLAVAVLHGHDAIVLGAFGCGVFRNEPEDVAAAFAGMLLPGGPFEGAFARVVFAVLDAGEKRKLKAFREAFRDVLPVKYDHKFSSSSGSEAEGDERHGDDNDDDNDDDDDDHHRDGQDGAENGAREQKD